MHNLVFVGYLASSQPLNSDVLMKAAQQYRMGMVVFQ